MDARWLWGVAAAGLLVGCGPEGVDQGAGAVGSQRSDLTYTIQGTDNRWVYTVAGWSSDRNLALTTDSTGDTIALLVDTSYTTPPNLPNIILRKLNSNGYLIWEQPFQGSIVPVQRGHGLGTDASGNIYLLWAATCGGSGCESSGTIDFGGGPTSSGALVKLSPTGQFVWQRPAPLGGAHDLAVNDSGESVFVTFNGSEVEIVKTRADGTIAWTRARGSSHDDIKVAIDPSGNVPVSGKVYPPDPLFGTTLVGGLGIARLAAADGGTLWAEALAPGDFVNGIGTSAVGTIVLTAGVSVPFTFAGQYFPYYNYSGEYPTYLLVLEPSGEQRFGRLLGYYYYSDVHMAMDPSGKVSVFTTRPFLVIRYNLAGDFIGLLNRGQLGFTPIFEGGPGDFADTAIAVASDRSTVIAGSGLQFFFTNGTLFTTTGYDIEGFHVFVLGGLFRAGSPSFIDDFVSSPGYSYPLEDTGWDVPHGSFIVSGSAARGTSFGSYAFWTGVPGPNDTAEITIDPSWNLGVIVRANPAAPNRDHYAGYVDYAGYIRIARRRDWGYSYLAIGPLFPSGSHRLSITATGSSPVRLTVQLDDSTVLTYDDFSPAALTGGGRAGMFDYNGLSQPIDRFRVILR